MNDWELISATTIENEAADWRIDDETLLLIEQAIDDVLPRSANLQGLANPVPPELRR